MTNRQIRKKLLRNQIFWAERACDNTPKSVSILWDRIRSNADALGFSYDHAFAIAEHIANEIVK